jgi:uncharacterized protein (TIGR03067 family)
VRTRQGALLLEGRLVLDATTTPKAITWIDAIGSDAGKPLPASYRLEGDSFVFIPPMPMRHGRAPSAPCRV